MANLPADTRRLRAIKRKPFPWYVLESLLFENGYQAVVLHRTASFFKRHGIPALGPLTARLNLFLTGVDIAPGAEIGPGLMISHGQGIVIGNAARIGSGALLMQGVTLGARTLDRIGEMPTVGDNVMIGAGAKLIGGITVGDHVQIGVNAVVAEDVPSRCKVLSAAGVRIVEPAAAPVPVARDGAEVTEISSVS
jgi:serine O-acetyltransferase